MHLTVDQWNQVGASRSEKAQFKAAIHCFRQALKLDERRHDIRTNLADNLRRDWQFDEALVEINLACKHGMFGHAQFVLGCIYFDMGLSDKALRYFTKKLCVTPYARFCRAQALLHAGQFTEGWQELEARLEMWDKGMEAPIPLWKGEPLDGKVVAIHHEEGFGDTIAYSRFLNLMPRGSYVLGVPSPLLQLMAASFDCPTFNTNEGLPQADYYLPLMCLPSRLSQSGPTIEEAYIRPLGKFDCPVDPDTRLKVGLVWRSKAGHDEGNLTVSLHGRQKSIPLELLLPLGDIPGVTLYSLQTDSSEIKQLGADYLIYDLGSKAMGFNDLALFMQQMDIIVSVDTAPLHLAGAMGLDCIGLLSCRGGWPYPGMGDTTPWYDSMVLVRQPAPDDWNAAIKELHAMISAELENAGSAPMPATAAAG